MAASSRQLDAAGGDLAQKLDLPPLGASTHDRATGANAQAGASGVPLLADGTNHHLAGQPREGQLQKYFLTGVVAIRGEHFKSVLLVNGSDEVLGGAVVGAYFSQGNLRPSKRAHSTTLGG